LKKLITLALCASIISLGVWSYTNNINVHTTKITSSETKIDSLENILKERNTIKEQMQITQKKKTVVVNKINVVKTARGEQPKFIPLKVVATAFSPRDNKSGICNDGESEHTSTGARPDWGTIAVDPKEIPYGTKMIIPNYNNNKICIAQDTGGALRKDKKNIRIDLYMDTYEQAMEWGKREITIYIVK
jgi:3D (Asp-Asp-Asp) domain-containing protein